jgi:hypothetical protein
VWGSAGPGDARVDADISIYRLADKGTSDCRLVASSNLSRLIERLMSSFNERCVAIGPN